MTNQNLIPILNHLLNRSHDAYKGFKEATLNATDKNLQQFLFKQAQQRYEFANQLSIRIKLAGGTPDNQSTLLSAYHRIWIDFKASVFDNSNEAVLEECIRGEEKALEDYNNALKEVRNVPEVKTLLKKHIMEIEANIKSAKILLRSYEKTEA